jgi:opacity protein-like surface antigen
MLTTTHLSPLAAKPARLLMHLAGLVVLCFATGLEARAVSPCTIALPNVGTSTPTINGIRGATEWNVAGLITSGDPCLDMLGDLPTGASRTVKVFSKLYGSGKLGFFFEIPDATQGGPCSSGKLCIGDKIVLQFDSNKSRGAGIAGGSIPSQAADLQIIITYKGMDGSGGVLDLETKIFARESFCPGTFDDITSSVTTNLPIVSVRTDQPLPGAGYSAEIEIPLALLGTPTSDFGFAFAVINDIGDPSCPSGVCTGFGIGFPNSLPITNAINPVTPGCSGWGDWIVPNNWGTAVFGNTTGLVSVSRSPDYWSNSGLLVYKCADTSTPNYEYFNNPPCKATLEARIRNNTGTPQTRNILFLWSPVGAGTPSSYNTIQFLENVPLPVLTGTNTTSVFTAPWDAPSNGMAHPCVRVYILPQGFVSGFPRSRIVSPTKTATDISQMETAYNIATSQWTQKNISQNTSRPGCNAGCDSTGAIDMREFGRGSERAEVAAAMPVETPWRDTPTSATPIVTDDQRLRIGARLNENALPFSPAGLAPPQTKPGEGLPPIVPQPGNDIRMIPEEFDKFSRDNVIVQVRAVGFGRSGSNATPRYNFLENLGGIIQMVPISILQQKGSVPFQFNVTNSTTEHTIFLVVDMFVPSGVSQVQVALDTGQKVYAPNENRVARGVVIMPGVNPSGGKMKRWGLSLHAGVSIPHGNFSNLFNPGPNVAVDLEYRITPTFSVEGIYGFHRFRGASFGTVSVGDINVHQFSFNGKVYGSTSPVRPFFNFGGGAYHFDSGGTTRAGLNVGGGLQFDVTPNFAVEGVYNFHNVFTLGSNTRFSGLQAGVRFRF